MELDAKSWLIGEMFTKSQPAQKDPQDLSRQHDSSAATVATDLVDFQVPDFLPVHFNLPDPGPQLMKKLKRTASDANPVDSSAMITAISLPPTKPFQENDAPIMPPFLGPWGD